MGKQKSLIVPPPATTQPDESPPPLRLSTLRSDSEIWFKVHVLLHDLSNLAQDPASQKRLSETTDELYISAPYFTDSEATQIRTARVVVDIVPRDPALEGSSDRASLDPIEGKEKWAKTDTSVEQAIQQRLGSFFEKRRASGDARPCGPHDMLPVYLAVFGVGRGELAEDRFLSRLRRSGLGQGRPVRLR